MLDSVSVVLRNPGILAPKQHIFLLSHMRSYTSLFGHIMGSNPDICGYYEMHIGYHSWKSLIRQKLLYFKDEEPKKNFHYMFDKVLHNEHQVASNILNSKSTRSIFCLRQPQEAIPSIIKLYQRVDPSHEFNSEAFATHYYIQRLSMLDNIARDLGGGFFYLDAESIKEKPAQSLDYLSDWLGLATPLSVNYEVQKNTSRERYGDTSEKLKSGRISNDGPGYSDFQFDEALMKGAADVYSEVRNTLLSLSSRHSIVGRAA